MTRLRGRFPLVASALATGLSGACATAPDAASPAEPSGPPSVPSIAASAPVRPPASAVPTPAPPPTTLHPPLADTDMDESRVCLLLPVAFEQLAAADRPASEVAADLEDAIARSRPIVDEAPDGAVRAAGEALLAEASGLVAQLRAGRAGGTLEPASSALETACRR